MSDWQNEAHVISWFNDVVDHLDFTKKPGSTNKERNNISRQMKQYQDPVDFYEYLFEQNIQKYRKNLIPLAIILRKKD